MCIKTSFNFAFKPINKNDSFFKALATLGFEPHRRIPGILISVQDADKGLSYDDVNDIAQKQIVAAVVKYLRSEALLNRLTLSIDLESDEVMMTIKPATFDINVINLIDFVVSLIITITLYFIIF